MKDKSYPFKISVIIPTYNRQPLLCYTLDSLCRQTLDKTLFEVIVSDDGSSDSTKAAMSGYREHLSLKYVYQADRGYRVASARNNAIKIAEGETCVFIDSGLILDADCLTAHLQFHSKKTQPASAIGYVYGFEHNEGSDDLLMHLIDPAYPSQSVARVATYPQFQDVREGQYQKHKDQIETLPAPWYYFWTCHVSVGTADLWQAGLFDESYDGRWGGEDNDLGIRLWQQQVKLCLLRSARSLHYPHEKDREALHVQGFESCRYLHEKFDLPGTKIFVEQYNNGFADINELMLHASDAPTQNIPNSQA